MPARAQQDSSDFGSLFWPTTLFVNILKTQQTQMQTMFAWQKAMVEMQQDLYDRWASQWADGARLND